VSLPLDTVIQGDCRAVMRSFPEESIDMAMFSPPYGKAYKILIPLIGGKNMNRNELLAYLAGIIDGEGSLSIKKSTYRMRSEKHRDMKHPEYSPRVSVKNLNKDVLMLLRQEFGGCVYREKQIYQGRNSFKRNRILWAYDVHSRRAYNLVKTLYPFLIIKKPQAEIILQLEQVKKDAKREYSPGFYGKPYDKETIDKLESLYQKMKKVNRGELTN
jgi:DNA modification methylase